MKNYTNRKKNTSALSTFVILVFTSLMPLPASAQAPTLGTYSNTSLVSGRNVAITPSVSPTNAIAVVASTNTYYTGVFTVNPLTGVVMVTNAKQAGVFLVTVRAFGSNGSTATTTFTLTVTIPNCSQGFFTNAPDIDVSSVPYSVAIGDFNNDGNQDMAVASPDNSSVSIRLGDGAGNFTGSTNVTVGSNPRWVSVGDFNGDGNEDIATANVYGNSASVRLGDGNGGFTGSTELPVGLNPYCVVIGDFNNDGKKDLAMVNTDSYNVSIRLGDGNGGFTGNTQVAVGILPFAAAVGDFNNDGYQDLAVANGGSNSVSIRIGDGLGNFSGSLNVAAGTGVTNVQIGDFNNDNIQDIVATNQNSNNVTILIGNGSGGFTANPPITVGSQPWSSAVGDFNGDGNQDIVTANYGGDVTELIGNGSGSFSSGTNINVTDNPLSIAVGDFNNDNRHDLVITQFGSDSVAIRLGKGLTLVIDSIKNINCLGGSDGQIDLSVTGGTPPYIYLWSNGASTQDVNVLFAGIYSVIVSDASGCSLTQSATVTNLGYLCDGSSLVFDGRNYTSIHNAGLLLSGDSLIMSNTGLDSFTVRLNLDTNALFDMWYNYKCKPGTTISKKYFGTLAGVPNQLIATSTITQINDSIQSLSYTFSQQSQLVVTYLNNDSIVSKDTVANGFSVNYNNNSNTWPGGGGGGSGDPRPVKMDEHPLGWHKYFHSLTNPGHFPAVFLDGGYIKEMPPKDWDGVNDLLFPGWIYVQLFEITYGGLGIIVNDNVINKISINPTNVSLLAYTMVNVDITANNISGININHSFSISANGNSSICPGSSVDFTCVTAPSAAVQWQLNQNDIQGATNATFTASAFGDYRVKAIVGGDTYYSSQFAVTDNAAIIIIDSILSVTCNGGNNGGIAINVSGGTQPYNYLWSNGATTQNVNGLNSGTYSLIVTDSSGCSSIANNQTISQPSSIIITDSIIQVACKNSNTGSIKLSVSGGTPPYSYSWSNGNVTLHTTGLHAGTYTVLVVDANGCHQIKTYTLNQANIALAANMSKVNVKCGGKPTGSINAIPTGGVPPYSYLWSNSAVSSSITNLFAGVYTCTITDAVGCVKISIVSITQNPILVVAVVPSGSTQATATVSGGIPPYTYYWSSTPPQTTSTAILLLPGSTYKVRVSDFKNCSKTSTVTMPIPRMTNSLSADLNITAFPNPAQEYVTLQFENATEGTNYEITFSNMLGEKVLQTAYKAKLAEGNQQIEIGKLSKGIYNLIIQSEATRKNIRLVIQ